MDFDWEKFLATYQAAPENIRSIIDSSIIADFVKEEIASGSLDEKNRQDVVVALSHYVVKATPENTLISILESKGVTNAAGVFQKAHSILNVATPTNQAADITNEIIEMEKEMAGLHSIRTMAADMQHVKETEVVHSSNQDALLNRQQDSAPTTPESSAPRWGSET